MGPVAALLDGRVALATLRRTLPRGAVLACRGVSQLARALESRRLDGVVLGPRTALGTEVTAVRRRFPRIPLVVFGALRPDDGDRIANLVDGLGASVLLEGLDDPVLGDLVRRVSATARRQAILAPAPPALRLTEPIQIRAWEILLQWTGRPPAASTLAARLGVSREHLSRQFAAGGAPNLKRVIDFLQVVAAAELLGNPGHRPRAVARLLGYSSLSHFRAVVRRVVALPVTDLARSPAPELLRRFVRMGMRSRA